MREAFIVVCPLAQIRTYVEKIKMVTRKNLSASPLYNFALCSIPIYSLPIKFTTGESHVCVAITLIIGNISRKVTITRIDAAVSREVILTIPLCCFKKWLNCQPVRVVVSDEV